MGVAYHAHARFLDSHGNKITVPAPVDADTPHAPWWYDWIGEHAQDLKLCGFSAILYPPVAKTISGHYNTGDGYGVFDQYDIGSKNQYGSVETRFGNHEQLRRSIAVAHACGLDVYVDVVMHQLMGGDNGAYRYAGADGKTLNGRFPKNPGCFRGDPPRRPEDPVPAPGDDFSFGDEFVYANCEPAGYTADQMIRWGDWLTRTLDVQGYRFDDVKGTWVGFVKQWMNSKSMADKFCVSEYFDTNPATLDWWSRQQMDGRSAVFDFDMHFILQAMCDSYGFNMQMLNGAGFTTWNPFGAVTFVDNPDTDLSGGENIIGNKLLAYAVILTVEGYPFVYHKDYATEPGCYGLKPWIDNLVWIHENLAFGTTVTQYVDNTVIVFNRAGYPGLLTAINIDTYNRREIACPTNFGPNVELQDYTGRHPNIWTDGNGMATFTVPSNAFGGGQSYLCFSRTGYGQPFSLARRGTTQTIFGAEDLDIGPALGHRTTNITRLWCQSGSPVRLAPVGNADGLIFGTVGPDGNPVEMQNGDGRIQKTGWHTLQVNSSNADSTPFAVAVTYNATQLLS